MYSPEAAPLVGVKVLDLGQFIAVPAATQLLADLGADVVKIESLQGEGARNIGIYGQAMLRTYNRGKRGVAIDLKHPRGRDLALELARGADILIQNLRPGAMARLGLGYADVKALNPQIVYASLTGFGTKGPSRDRAGLDIAAQAESGVMWVTGDGEGEPQRVGFPLVDAAAGHVLAEGVLAAYIGRLRSGLGDHVEVSLLDVAIHLQGTNWGEYSLTGEAPRRSGNGLPAIAPAADVLTTSDGAIVLSAYSAVHFPRLCALIGRLDLVSDPRFARIEVRVQHRAELLAAIRPFFAELTSEAAMAVLSAAGLVAGQVNDYPSVMANPDVAAASTFIDVVEPDGTSYAIPRSPLTTSHSRPRTEAPPALGRDTLAVLLELGLSAETVEDLVRMGVVRVLDEAAALPPTTIANRN